MYIHVQLKKNMASFSSLPMLVFFLGGILVFPKTFNDLFGVTLPMRLGGASGLHDRISAGVGRPLVDPQRQGLAVRWWAGNRHPKWVQEDMVGLVQKRKSLVSVPTIQDDLQGSNILDYPLESLYPLSFGCICACEGPVREGDILAGDPRKCWKSNSCCYDPGSNVLCCPAVQKVRRKVPIRPQLGLMN